MLADIAELRQRWRQNRYSEIEIWLRLLPYGFGFSRGVIGLTWARLIRATSILCYGVEQLLLLSRPIDDLVTMRDASGLMILTLRGLHQVMGSSGYCASRVVLWLSQRQQLPIGIRTLKRCLGLHLRRLLGNHR